MKQICLLLAGFFLLVLQACQNDEFATRDGEVAVTFTAQLPEGQHAQTRAAGDGAQINRCVLEVFLDGNSYLHKVVAVSNGTATFSDLRLLASKTYDFVFWADHIEGSDLTVDNHYDTQSLKAISFIGNYLGSSQDDTRDAFFASKSITVTNTFSESVMLYRPFGQLNIKTTDLTSLAPVYHPSDVKLTFANAYTQFNALTGEATGTPGTLAYYNKTSVVDANGNLTVDYLLAPETNQLITDIELIAYSANGDQLNTKTLNNIPLKRNYKTNVSGNLLTAGASITVNVSAAFNTPDLNHNIVEVTSIAEVANALENGNTNIVVTTAPTSDETISLPKYAQNDVTVSITLPATSNNITIDYSSSSSNANPPAALNVTTPSANNITIDAPQTTVTLNGQNYTTVTATTAPNTLVVGSGVEIGTLKMIKGGLKIYGKVTTFEKDASWSGTVTRCVSNQSDVENLLADNYSGYTTIEVETQSEIALDFKNTLLKKPIIVNSSVELQQLNVETSGNNSITLTSNYKNLNLTIKSSILKNTGSSGTRVIKTLGLNPQIKIYDAKIVATGTSNVRGIDVNSSVDGVTTIGSVLLQNTNIIATSSGNTIGNENYTDEQINHFMGLGDSRGFAFWSTDDNSRMDIEFKNSSIEGFYYAINIGGAKDYKGHKGIQSIKATNCYFDGRSCFNLHNHNITVNAEQCTLVGRNYFTGETEWFGNIVIDYPYGTDGNIDFTLNDSKFFMYNTPQTLHNPQFALNVRTKGNTIRLKGVTSIKEVAIGENQPRLNYVVDAYNYEENSFVIDPTVTIDGKEGAIVLPELGEDGTPTIPWCDEAALSE